jgi:flagellar biosynthesis component FlhA
MTPELTIPITVELSGSLGGLLAAKALAGFERGLGSQLASMVKDLGLNGDPTVKVGGGNSNRALRIRVHGKLQPYEPELLKKIWILVMPPASRNAIESSIDKSGFNDGWLTAYFSNLINSKSDIGLAFDFLTRVTLEIISERPACLVGPAQVSTYINNAELNGSSQEGQLPLAELSTLLKSLLDLGVKVSNYEVVRQNIRVGLQLRRSTADIVESIFTQLRSSSIEIHVNPEYLKKVLKLPPAVTEEKAGTFNALRKFVGNVLSTLTSQSEVKDSFPVYSQQVDDSIQTLFRTIESGVFNELGLRLPELRWVASTHIPDCFVSIKTNDHLSPPVLGLQAGELLVCATAERLKSLNIRHRTAPLMSMAYTIVNETDANAISQHEFTLLDISNLTSLVLSEEITWRAGRLVGVEDIEFQLAQIRLAFPALVRTVIGCYSLGDLTRVMRTLVAEKVSIRNVPAILEGMLKFDKITVPSEYIPFDARLELPETKPTDGSNWRNLGAFVRTNLKHFIGYNFGNALNSFDAFTVGPAVQGRAELAVTTDYKIEDDSWLSEAEQERFRDSAWTQFGQGHKTILTTTNARAPIHDLLAAEIRDVVVVSYSELSPKINVYPRGQITLDDLVSTVSNVTND